jgi:hypothetical protein
MLFGFILVMTALGAAFGLFAVSLWVIWILIGLFIIECFAEMVLS